MKNLVHFKLYSDGIQVYGSVIICLMQQNSQVHLSSCENIIPKKKKTYFLKIPHNLLYLA